ncbi:MAG: sensor histidine kinase [Anaerolineaceae bacterium]|nr:sensor histidine kinase [Anaerolineaceae bacterium]
MTTLSWDDITIAIYFLYGLALYSMGLALLVESGRASELGFARSMRLLAGFGLLNGIHEWLDMFEFGFEAYAGLIFPLWLRWLRLAILVTSFLALLAFGEHLFTRETYQRETSWRLSIGATIWFMLSALIIRFVYPIDEAQWLTASDVLARYILGIPSGLMACWALWRERAIFRERGMGRFDFALTISAISLALYGVVGQIFTGSSVIFPSYIINGDLFMQTLGFPVQLFRAVMATIVAVAMITILRALEVENQQRLDAVESSKLETERLSHIELERLNAELQTANDETARLLREVQRRDAVRGELLQRITAAQESERQRIARELHDGTGQALTGVALGLRGLAAQVKDNPEHVAKRLSVLESMATTSLGELRLLINDLRPPQLDDMGLAAALRWMVNRFKDQGRPEITLEIHGTPRPLPSDVETTLFRIAQEGLTNTAKHANADHVIVALDFSDKIILMVRDDGVGFNAAPGLENAGARTAWGLAGIQERANLINAQAEIHSEPGEGTTLVVYLNDFPEEETTYAY